MEKLSNLNFEKAIGFIDSHARELDKRLFAYYFEGGTAVSVLNALSAYQNDDGGFGNAIEPDFRLKASSPMATSVGLQYGTAVGATADHPIIQAAIRYLLDTYDSQYDYWPATYQNVNDAPHAFWWHVDKVEPPAETSWANPSAELIGYLHRYATLVPADFLQQVTARAQANLAKSATAIEQKYNVLCWQRAASTLPVELATAVTTTIERFFNTHLPIETTTFGELGALSFAPTPDAILAKIAPDTINQALDNEVTTQAADGGWWPGWHWGQYEDIWPIAKKEWAGKITVNTLLTLKHYNRLS